MAKKKYKYSHTAWYGCPVNHAAGNTIDAVNITAPFYTVLAFHCPTLPENNWLHVGGTSINVTGVNSEAFKNDALFINGRLNAHGSVIEDDDTNPIALIKGGTPYVWTDVMLSLSGLWPSLPSPHDTVYVFVHVFDEVAPPVPAPST